MTTHAPTTIISWRAAAALAPAAVVVFVEAYRALGAPPPIPFLLLYASVVLAARIGGTRPGLAGGVIASGYIVLCMLQGFGPSSLTGGVPQAALGIALHVGTAYLVGTSTDRGVTLLGLLRARQDTLEEAVAARTQELNASHDELAHEAAVRRGAQARLELAEHTAGLTRIELDRELQVTAGLESLEKLLGETTGADVLARVAPSHRSSVAADLRGIVDGSRDALDRSVTLLTHEGELAARMVAAVAADKERRSGVVIWLRDRTEEVRQQDAAALLRAQLEQAQRLDSLGVLAGGIAHDFNNILTAILGHSELLGATEGVEPSVRDHAQAIQHASQRAADLVKQMLVYAGRAEGAARGVDLGAELRATWPLVTSVRKDLRWRYEVPDEPASTHGDPTLLSQLLLNLLTNAAQASSPGDPIVATLTVEELEADDLRGLLGDASLLPGRYCCLRVIDQGTGMSEEQIERIFEPFFTTRGEGRGLGLSVVFGVVRQHRGGLRATSELGVGTTIEVVVPWAPLGVSPSRRERRTPSPSAGEPLRVLVVDDEPAIRTLVRNLLTRRGHVVTTAADGQEALAALARADADYTHILADLTMPGLTGHEVLEQAAEHHPRIARVLMSGYPDDHHRPGVRQLPKPFRAEELLHALFDADDEWSGGRG